MKKQVYKNRNAFSEIILNHFCGDCLTFRAKMHTGKSSIYLPCLSYETAKVHVISVKGQVLLQSLVNTKDIKLPYFLCFHLASCIFDRNY